MNENYTYDDNLEDLNLPNSVCKNSFTVPENFFELQQEEIYSKLGLEKLNLKKEDITNTVPVNYFETLENNIFSRIAENKLRVIIQNDGFTTPNNYFNELENSIKTGIVEDKLKNIASESGFIVPTNYFSDLEDTVVTNIKVDLLKSIIKEDGFTTSPEYFESLGESINSNILLEKLELNKSNDIFKTPSKYFEESQYQILEQTTGQQIETKSIKLSKNKKKYWTSFSAAAALLLVGIGTDISINSNKTDLQPNHIALANTEISLNKISDEEIVKYLAQELDGDDLMQLTQIVEQKTEEPLHIDAEIKESDIEEYLNYML